MRVPRPDLDAALVALTPRERQIVDYVAAGRPNKVIAIDLGISLRTAEAHRARIFAKLHTRNAMELACRLCAHGRSGASPILEAAAVDAAVAAERGAERGAATGSRPALGMAGGRPMTGSPTLPADANLPIVSQPIIPGIYSAANVPPMASSTTLHEPPLGYGVDPAAADDPTDDPTDGPTDDPTDDPADTHD